MALDLEKIDLGSFGVNKEEDSGPLTDQMDTGVKANLNEAFRINPDQHAKENQLSRDSGVPAFAVRDNTEQVEHGLKLDKIDFDGMSRRSPHTSKYLTEFNNAVIAQDDIDVLQSIEDTVFGFTGRVKSATASVYHGLAQMPADIAKGHSIEIAELASFQMEQMDRIDRGEDLGFFTIPSPAIRAYRDADPATRKILRTQMLAKSDPSKLTGYALGEQIEETVREQLEAHPEYSQEFLAGKVPEGFGSMLGFLATSVVGRLFGAKGGFAQVPTVEVASQQMASSEFQSALGDGATMEEAFRAGNVAQFMAPAEALPIARMFDRADDATGGTLRRAVFDMLQSGTEEAIQEGAQSIWSNMIAADIVGYDPDRGLLTGTGESASVGFTVGALTQFLVSMIAGRRTRSPSNVDALNAEEIRLNALQTEEQNTIDRLNEKSTQSTTRQRDSESFRQFVKDLNEQGESNVHITGTAVRDYLAQHTTENIETDPALRAMAEQVGEASALGGYVVIPVEDFATDFTGTDHFQALRQDMKMSADTATPNEVEDQVGAEDFRAKMLQEAEDRTTEYVEAQNIATDLISQLVDTGRMNAQDARTSTEMVSAYVAVKARQENIGVQEAWNEYGFTIEGPLTGEKARLQAEGEILSQARESGYGGNNTVEASEWQRAVDKGLDMSTDARMQRASEQGYNPDQVWYHGTSSDVQAFDLDKTQRRDFGFAGKGVYVTPVSGVARSYANTAVGDAEPNIMPLLVAANNPMRIDLEYKNKIAKELGEAGADSIQQGAIEQGFDSIEVVTPNGEVLERVIFNPSNIRSVNAAFDPDFTESPELLAQSGSEDLVVTHNLSEENLKHVAKLGGLAAPSLAVQRASMGFDDFGEISLLADPSVIEDRSIKFFDSDIYTPRQQRAQYDVDDKLFYKLMKDLEGNTEISGLSLPDIYSMENDGVEVFLRNEALQYHWLKSEGKAPRPVKKKLPPIRKKAIAYAKRKGYRYAGDLVEDPKFASMMEDHFKGLADLRAEKKGLSIEDVMDIYFDGDTVNKNILREEAYGVINDMDSAGIDTYATRDAIRKKMRVKKNTQGFEEYVERQFNNMLKGEKLFVGTSPTTGAKRYKPYTLDNVVREMTRTLQGGEDFHYSGAGFVRSSVAKKMMTVGAVQKRRDQIVSKEQMESIKEESDKRHNQTIEDLRRYYKFDQNSYHYGQDAEETIMQYALNKGRLSEAFDMSDGEVQRIVDEHLTYLSELPTGYFEGKAQRAMDLSEFKVAVVPKGASKETVQTLKDAGLTIRRYDTNKEGDRSNIVGKQKKLLFQRDAEKPAARGFYDPQNSIIRLTEASDLSTFIHEFAHFMYETELKSGSPMIESINGWYKRNAEAVANEAEADVSVEDVNAYLDTGTTGAQSKDEAIRVAVHEQFARGFETYIMEGKAPSIELRNAFQRMARWMVEVYRAITLRKPNLDAEMREVFDRLLATEEQIEAAKARQQYEPMFTDAAMAGMTETEFAEYQKKREKVEDKATETLRDKMVKEITRQTEKWWKEEKADIVDEEIARLSEERVYRARNALKDGNLRMDHATIKEQFGEERTDKRGVKSIRIPPALNGMTAKGKKGVHPDEAAAFLGYSSGSEMVGDLINAAPIKEVAETNAEQIMKDRHGDMLNDGSIEKLADQALQNEERGKLILSELKALSRGTNQSAVDRKTIQALAAERIGELSYRQINPGKYRRAEIKAAQESARMLAEGNREGAAAAKARQVMNFYLGKEAMEARNETLKVVDRMKRYNKKAVREEIMKAEGGYWEQIERILSRFEFRKSATLTSVDQVNESIQSWAAKKMNEEGDALVLSNAVLNESYITHWKNVPYSEVMGINDSVKNIEHVARYGNKIRLAEEEIEFKKLVEKWVTSVDENVKTRFKPVASVADKPNKASQWGRWMMAQMTKIPYMASWLDGGERAGISHDILVQPLTDAYAAKLDMWEEIGAVVMSALEHRKKADLKRHNTKVYIPEIAGTQGHTGNMMGHEILAVALNTGNQSNLKKMLLGEGWADPEIDGDISLDNPRLQAVLQHMTKADWELVQMIWDQMEKLYPQLAEVHRRTTGLAPPKVEATPLTLVVEGEEMTLRGGYYPVKYDPERDIRAQENEDKLNAETESMFNNTASIQASVTAGATNERTGYYAPIKLSLEVVPNHFDEVIHYITHHDAVRQINKMVRNKSVAQTITEKLGKEEYAQLKPWLNDVAKDGREAPTKMFWDSALQKLRFGVTLGAMGFKASTGLIQISGLSNSIAELGVGPVMQSMRSILGSPTTMREAWEFASENSKVLKHRTNTMDREIKNAMKRLEGKRGVLAAVQEVSMKHIAYIQTYMVDLPTWHAAYIKEMKESGDERKAYRRADWTIENVQGSGVTKDMARIMRGQSETGRMFTMFMTFFSSLWNMERDLVRGAKSGTYSTTTVATKAMFLFTIPVLFEMAMRGELGEPEGDEDDRLQQMLTKTALYPIQSVPFVRDIASGVVGDYGYNLSPMQQILESGVRTIPEVVTRGFTDEEITKGQAKGATKFIGAAVGIPGTGQAWATGEHLYDVIEEGEELTVHQLLFGPKRD